MSTWDPEHDVELTDSEDEIAMKRDFHGREAILFVVDANLKTDRLMDALKLIRGAFISGMLVNGKDLMGLMFANTAHSPPPQEKQCLENIVVPANCAIFLPMRQLTKAIVEHFLEFMASAEELFASEYGLAQPDGRGSYAYMIRLCIELLEKCGKKLNNAKIVYITDVEEPHPQSSREFQAALQKASDLEGKEFEFQVIPMIDDFDYEPFYKEFITLSRAIDIDSFRVPDAQLQREILEDRKLRQDFLRRCLGHFNLSLGPNLAISVQFYNYFQRRAYPNKVHILRRDNSVVRKKRMIMVRKQDEETQEITHEYQIKTTGGWHECRVGDQVLRVTTEQLNRVRNLHPPGMMLLGFKHRSALPDIHYSKPCSFMYPDDQNIVGSKRLFRALWQRCLERQKIAICLFMCKRKSVPRYVALLPVEAAQPDDTNYRSLLSGDGFKIVYLPEAKHIRNIDMCEWNSIKNTSSDEGVELFQKVIKRLSVDYQPNFINDPNLEVLQSNLLALALNIKTEQDGISQLPDPAVQDKRIEKFLPLYDKIFGPEVEPAKKRAAKSSASDESAAKMPKIDEEQLKSLDIVKQLIEDKRLSSCTSEQLRFILDQHFDVRPAKSTTKAVLIERIENLSV
ncbi:ATP-dependent DNA helicase 2 subunit 1 [Drosophila grimshawi]|uniref:ATP-dependent DNA helicase 2 subunit 1 n=1 Tax=Drosophila grimshawi TaxID=7222 RepID=B4JF99_DROGR|nr:ATP-dependent DNA helicase 2 subunit 1 [Drosophila grimshawi]EDV93380.1 GH18304 [Drosophila grimshawi]